jgi:uncharacterized protein YkwD
MGLLVLIVCSLPAAAQKYVIKAEQKMDENDYRKALAYIEKALDDDISKREPGTYVLHSKILLELSKDPYYREKEPDVLKDAVKAMERAIRKDDNNRVLKDNSEHVDSLCVAYNGYADAMYKVNKFPQAIRAYKRTYDLNQNWKSLFMLGKSYLYSLDTVEGERHYDQLIDLYYEESKQEEPEYQYRSTEPFEYYGNKYWMNDQYDSANIYLEMARGIFGPTREINFYLKKIAKEQINEVPPSSLMMTILDKNLAYFPTDTFFIHKQNALYIYLLKNAVSIRDEVTADTLLSKFAREKAARAASKEVKKLKRTDDFISEKPENAVWKLVKYLHLNGHQETAIYALDHYIDMTSGENELDRWKTITQYAFDNYSLDHTVFIYNRAKTKFPTDSRWTELRNEILNTYKDRENLSLGDQAALVVLMRQNLKDPELLKTYRKRVIQLSDQYVREDQYEMARKLIGNSPELEDQERQNALIYLAKEDFFDNYYNTRTIYVDASGTKSNEFEWNGSVGGCRPGEVSEEIQEKIQQRINYFRRNAGIPEIVLHPDLNAYCQEAALMMEANKKLDHDPPKNWRCYSKDGAYAARVGLLTKDANTAIAVTSFMADQNNPSVGNRRWMLYPNGELFGHGSTENYAVIWAVDDSGRTDSATYEKQFVSWPPEGYTPSKMVFNHWSFSLYRDLEGATVTMSQGGQSVPVKMQPLTEGYGMPTLVWTPDINLQEIDKPTDYNVTIRLSDGRKYNYTVGIFPFNPVGY